MTSLASSLERLLHPGRLRILRTCAEVAVRKGVDLYLVGGTVRDVMLTDRLVAPDIDLTGPGVDGDFASSVAEALGGRFAASSAFGTYKVYAPDDAAPETPLEGAGAEVEIDLAMSRRETYSSPGALPEVRRASLMDDLGRRDFSIGAMCVVLAPPVGSGLTWGDLIDPFDGKGDVERGLVRVLHQKSFLDDPTRIFRAVRYSVRLGFELEDRTAGLMAEALGHIDLLSGDRVRHELEHIFDEVAAGDVIARCHGLGVLAAVFPELAQDPAVQPTAMEAAGSPSLPRADRWDTWTGVLAYSVPPDRVQAFCERLNLSSRTCRVVNDVAAIRSGHLRSGGSGGSGSDPVRPSEVYAFLSHRSEAAIRACIWATADETLRSALVAYMDHMVDAATLLNGDDLIGLGVPEGPVVGRLLRELLHARLDGRVATVQDEERVVRSTLVPPRADPSL